EVLTPEELARARIEGSNHTAWCIDPLVVRDGRSHNHAVSDDCGWRRHLIFPAPSQQTHIGSEIVLAFVREIRACSARVRVDRKEPAVVRASKNSRSTDFTFA